MRGLTGLTLVLAGSMVGLYGGFPAPVDRERVTHEVANWVGSTVGSTASDSAERPLLWGPVLVADASRVTAGRVTIDGMTGGTATDSIVADSTPRVFSPRSPLFQPIQSAAGADTMPAAPTTTGSTSAPETKPTATDKVGTHGKQTPEAAVAPPLPRPVSRPGRAGQDELKRDLARTLQSALKRVGCYDGDITTTWTPAAKRAMKSFTERVNASLPTDEPDYILLTLVQGHSGPACGQSCPSEQVMGGDGRCLPRAIVAQNEKKAASRSAAAKALPPTPRQAGGLVAQQPAAQVAGAAGGKSGAAATSTQKAGTGGWQTRTVAAAAPAPAPSTTAPSAAAPVVAGAPTPLPGRMAVGAPRALEASEATSNAPPAVAAIPLAGAATLPKPQDIIEKPADDGTVRSVPKPVIEVKAPRPQRYSPPYRVGASSGSGDSAYRPYKPPKSARVRSMHYNLYENPHRSTN